MRMLGKLIDKIKSMGSDIHQYVYITLLLVLTPYALAQAPLMIISQDQQNNLQHSPQDFIQQAIRYQEPGYTSFCAISAIKKQGIKNPIYVLGNNIMAPITGELEGKVTWVYAGCPGAIREYIELSLDANLCDKNEQYYMNELAYARNRLEFYRTVADLKQAPYADMLKVLAAVSSRQVACCEKHDNTDCQSLYAVPTVEEMEDGLVAKKQALEKEVELYKQTLGGLKYVINKLKQGQAKIKQAKSDYEALDKHKYPNKPYEFGDLSILYPFDSTTYDAEKNKIDQDGYQVKALENMYQARLEAVEASQAQLNKMQEDLQTLSQIPKIEKEYDSYLAKLEKDRIVTLPQLAAEHDKSEHLAQVYAKLIEPITPIQRILISDETYVAAYKKYQAMKALYDEVNTKIGSSEDSSTRSFYDKVYNIYLEAQTYNERNLQHYREKTRPFLTQTIDISIYQEELQRSIDELSKEYNAKYK